MSIITNHQIISCLHRYDVSDAMIKILERQRISAEDLQTMDRDDIEHLFKNEYDFTFRDRKQFWNALQEIRSTSTLDTQNDILQDDESLDIYEVINDEPTNHTSTQEYIPLLSARINNHFQSNPFKKYHSADDDSERIATTLLPICDGIFRRPKLKSSSASKFQCPIELPIFSARVIKAFQTHSVNSEWKTFMNELCDWILSIKKTRLQKCEYQAIGKSLYEQYPAIGKDGFRPWSSFCRSLTQNLRRERQRRGLPVYENNLI